MELSLFVRRPDGTYDRLEERQTQRAHARQELRRWLEDAGFSSVRFFGRLRMTAPRTGDDRWHVAAVKEKA
jgi:histidyl-tRNA synthetase